MKLLRNQAFNCRLQKMRYDLQETGPEIHGLQSNCNNSKQICRKPSETGALLFNLESGKLHAFFTTIQNVWCAILEQF